MKNKNYFRRIAATLMAGALMASVLTVSAFAETTTTPAAITSVSFNKTITTDGNTYAPNTAFIFTVATAAAEAARDGQPVYAGVTDGAKFADGANTIAFNPATDGMTGLTKATSISLDASKFTKPGIYHYTVAETAGTYDGITYDTAVRDLYVYVRNNANNSGFEVYGAIMANAGTKSDVFTNDYGATNDTTHDLTITKTVTGAQGDMNKAFAFTVKVDGADGEQYKFVTADGTVTYLVSGTETTIALKNGESAKIFGLSENDTYTVVETDANTDGYTTTFENSTGTVADDATVITCTNNREATTPTGIILSIAPYVLMVALAGVFAFIFLRKKNHAAE